MKINRIAVISLCSALILILLVACSTVELTQPLPSKITSEEQSALSGKWNAGGDILHIEFDKDGTGHFAGIEWDSKFQQFRLNEGEFVPCVAGDAHYASIRVKENGVFSEEYLLIAYRFNENGDLQIGGAEVEPFAKAIEDKKLKGTVKKDKYSKTVTLTGTPEEIVAFLKSNGGEKLFEFKDSNVMKKLKLKEDKPEKKGVIR